MRLEIINRIIEIAKQAGECLSAFYVESNIAIEAKQDGSPLTQADKASHELICQLLENDFPSIPILSEESIEQHHYRNRAHWDYFFLVDPLDGTKEFIQRNGEFTVNIALIEKNYPVLGVIYAPMLHLTYYAELGKGAYKIAENKISRLMPTLNDQNSLRVVVSRSHQCEETKKKLAELSQQEKSLTICSVGSALKFGLIANGDADVYLRASPSMEWDTAAGQIIVQEAGKKMVSLQNAQPLIYNKESLLNPGFIVR